MAGEELLIVGGGAAAFAAATRAADLDVPVTMVNEGLPLGGTCVNVGCMPSKFLLESLDRYQTARGEGPEWLRSSAELDYSALKRAKDDLVEELRKQNYEAVVESLGNVTLVEGRARFTGPRTVEVEGRELSAQRVLIATGGRTDLSTAQGLAEVDALTNVTALELETPPETLGIVGAGPLGCEFAQIFQRAGSQVHLFGRVLPGEEPELQDVLSQSLESEGVTVHAGTRVQRVDREDDGGVGIHHDEGRTVVAEVLAATGIRPNTDGLGLEAAGVATDARGFVAVDEHQRTNVAGTYAAGDVTGTVALETTAAKQGANAAHHALTGEGRTVAYDHVPHAVFTDPQVASVGWTEEEQLERTGTCWCRVLPMANVPKAHATGDTTGLVKLVVDPDTREIKGAHAVGRHAAETIHLPTLALRAGFTLDDLIDTVHVFPTYAEAWKLCAQSFDRDLESMSCCIG